MSGRRLRASSLLLVLFTSMSLGICAAALSAADRKLPCCADILAEEASLTACCPTGKPASAELPAWAQVPLPPTSEIAFVAASQTPPLDRLRRYSPPDTHYRSADRQALLSTFLI